MIARVREVFGVELAVRRLFETPTLAALVERIAAEHPAVVQPPLVRRAAGETVPLSFAQERLWFMDQLEPGGVAYVIPGALRLEGDLDEVALERSLVEIVRRHESLRTVFRAESGRPLGRVMESAPQLERIDLSAVADGWSAALRLAREEVLRPFDLSRGPLARFALLRLGAQDHVLLLSLHHIATDGWSLGRGEQLGGGDLAGHRPSPRHAADPGHSPRGRTSCEFPPGSPRHRGGPRLGGRAAS